MKEDDRVRQIEAVNAQTGPVMIGYPAAPEIDAMLARAAAGKPDVDVTADDGVRHQMWVIADDATIGALTRAFDALPALYIADGHHRSAAAARVARRARRAKARTSYFLVGDLSASRDDHPRLQPRAASDLNGRSAEQLLAELRKNFTVDRVRPAGPPGRVG